jgi:hypothetical protein
MTCSGRVVPAVQRPLVGDQPVGHGRVQAEPAHHLPGEPVRQRPFPQLGLQPGPLRRAPATPALGPQRFGPAVPPGPVPPAHRPFGDPQVAHDLVDRVAAASRSAACGRSRSRRCCSAGVYPPRCAYRIPRSYACSQPTSRLKLYEFKVVSRAVWRLQRRRGVAELGGLLTGLAPQGGAAGVRRRAGRQSGRSAPGSAGRRFG